MGLVAMDTLLSILAVTVPSLLGYLTFKHQKLPSEGDIRRELEERLDQEFHVTTPLAARRYEEIDWRGDFYITINRIQVFETRWARWKKWLPGRGFDGRAKLHIRFHGTEIPPEEELWKHFVAQNPHTRQLNKHLDDPFRIDILLDTANIDYITGRYVHIFREMIQDTCFRLDNPGVDEDWLLHPSNTNTTYRNGHLYNTLTQSKMMPILMRVSEDEIESDEIVGSASS